MNIRRRSSTAIHRQKRMLMKFRSDTRSRPERSPKSEVRSSKSEVGALGSHRVMDCGGKRSATPLSHAPGTCRRQTPLPKRHRRFALPVQSKIEESHFALRTSHFGLVLSLFCFLVSSFCNSAFAQGSAFTYQGRLNDAASPAAGTYDLRFTIYGLAAGGNAVAGPITNSAVSVT